MGEVLAPGMEGHELRGNCPPDVGLSEGKMLGSLLGWGWTERG